MVPGLAQNCTSLGVRVWGSVFALRIGGNDHHAIGDQGGSGNIVYKEAAEFDSAYGRGPTPTAQRQSSNSMNLARSIGRVVSQNLSFDARDRRCCARGPARQASPGWVANPSSIVPCR
jgi:hypothetical protein